MEIDKEYKLTDSDEQFAIAIEEHRRSLLAYAFTCSRDLSVAEDVVQETCLIAMKKKDQYEEFIDFGAWLIAIARRVWLQECDRRRINSRAMNYLHDNASIIFTPENFEKNWQEEKKALQLCLKQLEGEDQKILKNHFENKEKYKSLANRFNCTVANIKVRMFRLRKSLRQCINRKLEATQ